jgi:hypothetical protein
MMRIGLKARLSILLACLLAAPLMAGCAARDDLPAGAGEAIELVARDYYTSGQSGSPSFKNLDRVEITHAWRAKDALGAESANKDAELWCAEVTVKGERSGISSVLTAIWVVARDGPQAMWRAAALETISAATTIERCNTVR